MHAGLPRERKDAHPHMPMYVRYGLNGDPAPAARTSGWTGGVGWRERERGAGGERESHTHSHTDTERDVPGEREGEGGRASKRET